MAVKPRSPNQNARRHDPVLNPAFGFAQRAERVVEDLAQLFRVALAETGASVALDEEIDLAQRYLAIEQVRYGTRLQVSWDVDGRVGSARVPPLVLQPLVENAVRHGVEPALGGGRIWVQAFARRGQAVVLVSNTVVAKGEVVTVSGNYGVRITDVISAAERARYMEVAS